MRNVRVRRFLAALTSAVFVALLGAVLAAPATAGPQTVHQFSYRFDKASWYWTRQRDQVIEAGPVSQRVRVRNPQQSNTLPVALTNGEYEKISALYFSLADRGVLPGSKITRYVLRMQELSGRNEFPAYNHTDKQVLACRIDDFWAPGEAEEWPTQPPYGGKSQEGDPAVSTPPFAKDACVEGKRDASKTPAEWTFDLTSVAERWGEDPFGAYNGVMFVPAETGGGARQSWQVNFKVPDRDNPETDPDEYEQTKQLALLELAFTAPEAPEAPTTTGGGFDGGFGGGTGGGDFDPGTAVSPGSFEPGTMIEPSGPPASVEPPAAEGPQTAGQPVAQTQVEMPAIVWALVPVGLLALALARSVVVDGVAAGRPGGVVASIRERNAARRGLPLHEETGAGRPRVKSLLSPRRSR